MYNNPYNFTTGNFFPQMQNYTPATQNALQGYNTIQYVNGRDSVNAFAVRPNDVVPLFDQNAPYVYIKGADATGFCKTKRYRLVDDEMDDEEKKYVTQEEFEKFKIELKNLTKKEDEV